MRTYVGIVIYTTRDHIGHYASTSPKCTAMYTSDFILSNSDQENVHSITPYICLPNKYNKVTDQIYHDL